MRKIWAIVRLTISESLRTRLALAFILLLVGVMILLISTASGDGTIRGKIQMFMSYSMGLTHFLLAMLMIFLACRTLDQDIKTQRIDSIVCKPIARWQLLLGRWLGIVILATFLFCLSMGTTYLMVRMYARSAPENSEDKFRIENQVLVARRGFIPPLPDVSDFVQQRYQRLREQGELPANMSPSDARSHIADQAIRQSRTVNPRHSISWTFKNLRQPQEGEVLLTLRFKYEPSKITDLDEEEELRGNTIVGRWIIGQPQSSNVYIWQEEQPYRTLHEIDVPINAIEEDGTLTVTFQNIDPRHVSVHFPLDDGIEILLYEGTFTQNFIRTALIVLFTLLFVVTLALACGTFLSFPIASLVALSIFFLGMSGNFLADAVGLKYGMASENLVEMVEKIIAVATINIVPVLDVSPYTSHLIDGKIVDWQDVAMQMLVLVVFKAGVLGILGGIIFHRRELGKIII